MLRRSTSSETAARAIAIRERRDRRKPRRKLKRQLFVGEIVRQVDADSRMKPSDPPWRGAPRSMHTGKDQRCPDKAAPRPAVTTFADQYIRALLGDFIADAMGST